MRHANYKKTLFIIPSKLSRFIHGILFWALFHLFFSTDGIREAFASPLASREPIKISHQIHLPLTAKSNVLSIVPYKEIKRPKIGLALSGGGLRGIAQIGVLKVLEENQIPIDYIIGVSIGAVVGGLYAAGYHPADLWREVSRLKWDKILFDTPKRDIFFLAEKQKRGRALFQVRMSKFKFYLPGSFTPGQTLSETLTDLLFNAPFNAFDFSRLYVPLKIITTDLLSGRKIVISQGSLVDAMRASIAIPLLFTPVEYDSLQLVDGGLLDNIPVEETRKSGVDIIIAVNCTANLREKGKFEAPWEMVDQVTTIMQQEHNYSQLQKADIIIDFQDFSSMATDEQSLKNLYEEGQNRTLQILPQLQSLILKKRSEWFAAQKEYFIDHVQLSGYFEPSLTNMIQNQEKRFIKEGEIMDILAQIYQNGNIKNIFAEIVSDSSMGTKLVYHIEPLPVLNRVIFYGNDSIGDSILLSSFQPILGKVLNHKTSQEAIKNVIRTYRSSGYSLAEISQISFEEESGIAHIHITEGIIDNVYYIGNHTTRNYVLNREFPLSKGDTFRLQEAKSGIANLYGTGLFDAVNFAVSPSGNKWNVYIKLQEKKYTVFRVGAHYDEERYGKTFFEVNNENILGTGNDLTFHSLFGSRENNFLMFFNTNRIFKSYLTGNINLQYKNKKYFFYKNYINNGEYQRRAFGISFGMGTQISRLGTLSAIMRIERIKCKNIISSPIVPSEFPVQTIGIHSVVDTRDQVPYSFSGKYYNFSYEVSSGRLLGSKISYFKVNSTISTFWTFFRRHTFSPKLVWGTSDIVTPFSEQYHVGGENSFFGLRDDALVGKNILIASWEYRYWIPWNRFFDFFLSFRFDFGSVWQDYIKVQSDDFISGKGLSISLKSPIGPISLSYGTASRNQRCFYFSAGYNF